MARRIDRLLRRAAVAVAIALGALVLAFVVVVTIGFRVDLSFLRAPAAGAASRALGRAVTLAGPMTLVPTWSPTLEVEDVRVANPCGWPSPELARLGLARLRVGLLPLLRRNVVIRELRAERVAVRFERLGDGRVNWNLLGEREAEAATAPEPSGDPQSPASRPVAIRSIAFQEIALREIEVDYRDEVAGEAWEVGIDELDGSIATHDPLELEVRGRIGATPWEASLEGDPPADLLLADDPWPLAVALEIAGTRFELATRVDVPLSAETQQKLGSGVPLLPPGSSLGEITFAVEGERLDSLDALLGTALPPWGPHALRGTLRLMTGRAEADLDARVEGSRLEGHAELRRGGDRPRIAVELAAPEIQLDDFELGDWRPTAERVAGDSEVVAGDSEVVAGDSEVVAGDSEVVAPDSQVARLFSEETLGRLDGSLEVRVGRVRSGRDALGAGELVMRLEDGRLSLAPVRLEGEGGAATLEVAFHPSGGAQSSELRLLVERFDYSLLARRLQPDTKLSGLFAIDLQAQSRGPLGQPLLAHADGHLDVAVFPNDLSAGLIDLWTVNLLRALLPILDPLEGSEIDCVVALFDLEGGVLRERELLLDTTNMSVGGTVEIDFRARTIEALLTPRAKKPTLLSLATPVRVRGSFEDFGVGVTTASLLQTTVRVVTSPVHVPVRRLLGRLRRPVEVDDCLAALRQAKRAGRP